MKTEIDGVITADIEVMRSALNTAYYKSLSEDMGRAYTNLANVSRESALTKLLSQALQKADGYLELAQDEEPVDAEEVKEDV